MPTEFIKNLHARTEPLLRWRRELFERIYDYRRLQHPDGAVAEAYRIDQLAHNKVTEELDAIHMAITAEDLPPVGQIFENRLGTKLQVLGHQRLKPERALQVVFTIEGYKQPLVRLYPLEMLNGGLTLIEPTPCPAESSPTN